MVTLQCAVRGAIHLKLSSREGTVFQPGVLLICLPHFPHLRLLLTSNARVRLHSISTIIAQPGRCKALGATIDGFISCSVSKGTTTHATSGTPHDVPTLFIISVYCMF